MTDRTAPPSPAEGPVWDDALSGWVTRVTDRFVVSWAPQLFNDRVFLTRRSDYPATWVAAWCFDKGGAAALAAALFDPEVHHEPVGFKKVAADSRSPEDLPHTTPS